MATNAKQRTTAIKDKLMLKALGSLPQKIEFMYAYSSKPQTEIILMIKLHKFYEVEEKFGT